MNERGTLVDIFLSEQWKKHAVSADSDIDDSLSCRK